MSFGYLHDKFGNKSSKRLIATWGALIGYLLAIVVVIYGLNHQIQSQTVVTNVLETIVGVPFLTLVSTVFEKRRKNDA